MHFSVLQADYQCLPKLFEFLFLNYSYLINLAVFPLIGHLVAGKGHEDYQEIKGIKHHFDDREIIQELFQLQNEME